VKYLLDTHVFLWFVLDDPQLSATALRLIEDPANDFEISPGELLGDRDQDPHRQLSAARAL